MSSQPLFNIEPITSLVFVRRSFFVRLSQLISTMETGTASFVSECILFLTLDSSPWLVTLMCQWPFVHGPAVFSVRFLPSQINAPLWDGAVCHNFIDRLKLTWCCMHKAKETVMAVPSKESKATKPPFDSLKESMQCLPSTVDWFLVCLSLPC